jgi:hypothetical protein
MARAFFVRKRFAAHDMAPVAGGITDGDKDRFILGAGFGEGFLAPRMPIHRVFRVLGEVGGFLLGEAVFGHGFGWFFATSGEWEESDESTHDGRFHQDPPD